MALSVSRLVRVLINLSPLAAARRSFGALLAAGDSNVISGLERIREYSTYEAVLADFGVDTPESKAAAAYFGQSPKPKTFFAGRWISANTSGFNKGGALTTAEQLLSKFTSVSNGGINIPVDGVAQIITGLDFTGVTNLNGVADVINAKLTGAVCAWNGSRFIITSNSTGAGYTAQGSLEFTGNPSYGVRANGTITLSGNPSNGDDVVINGTTVTFVTGTPAALQVLIGATKEDTAANLQLFLEASADVNLAACTYNTISNVTTITARVYGTAGNSYTLSKTGAAISVSGAGDLSGGVAPDTLTLGGNVITFVQSNPSGLQCLVGPTAAATEANLNALINSDYDLSLIKSSVDGAFVNLLYYLSGVAGNSYTLAKSCSVITLSGSTLASGANPSAVSYTQGGSGTDLTNYLKLNEANSAILVAGYNAETPAECVAVLANKSADWYGLTFAAASQPSKSQNVAVAAIIEALDLKRVFGVTITDLDVLDSEITTDLASQLKALGYNQSFVQFSSTNSFAICSLFGRMFSVDFNANRSTITLMYKQEPGVIGEELTESQANVLKAKRCNVFVNYVNNTVIIQYGVMCGSAWIDEIHGLDWLQNAIQTNAYNALYLSKTKIPQTDSGANKIVNAVNQACEDAINNGLIAPGIWNADGFGQLSTGDYLKSGYYTFAQSVDLQSQSDRDARVAPPIQTAIKLAGAIQEVDVLVNVNR